MIRLVFDLIYLYRMYPIMEIAQTMTQQNGNCASLCKITFCRICEQKERFFIWLGSSTAEEAKLSAENAKAKQWRTASKAGKRSCQDSDPCSSVFRCTEPLQS